MSSAFVYKYKNVPKTKYKFNLNEEKINLNEKTSTKLFMK